MTITYKYSALKKLFLILTFLSFQFGFSQTLVSKLDKKTLALGEPGNFTVEIIGLSGKTVKSAAKNELLPFHFEAIKDSASVQPNTYYRNIEFAVFQEGKFTIPQLDFTIDGKLYKTAPYEIEVVNTAQKSDQINDIMNNKQVKLEPIDYWQLYKWYVLAAIIVIGSVFVIYQLIKYGKSKKSSPVMTTNKTLKDLDALKKKKYIENGDYRSFYVELIDISRGFLTTQYRVAADVLLTDDLIELLKTNNTISSENEKVVEDIFYRGDLVKFAKTFPNQTMMEQDFQEIKNFVKRSAKDLELENLRNDI